MKCQYASYSGLGSRSANEDSLSLQNCGTSLFAAVADGVGGHANGQNASQLVTDILGCKLVEMPFLEQTLLEAIDQTGEILCDTPDAGYSTLACLWLQDYQAYAAHIGDSRIYQFRGGEILYQSADHSIVQISVAMGDMDPADIRTHQERSKLYRVMGNPGDRPIAECVRLDALPGDRFLLCSDGFWEPVTEEEMCLCCREAETVEQWITAMTRKIQDNPSPSQDNYTAICMEVL